MNQANHANSMSFLPLCASTLGLRESKDGTTFVEFSSRESTGAGASRESTDVLEDCAPSRSGSDNQYDQSGVSSDQSADPDLSSGPDTEVVSQLDRCAVLKAAAPWRRKLAGKGGADNTIRAELREVPSPCRSFADVVAPTAFPSVAVVMRWDGDSSSWVKDEIEITEAPPLPRFARLIAFPNGAERCAQKDGYSCEISLGAKAGGDSKESCSRISNCGEEGVISSSAWNWFCNAEATKQSPSSSSLRAEAEPFFLGGGKSTFNKSAPVFVPGQEGTETVSGSPTSTFNPGAPVFVPAQGEAEVASFTLDCEGTEETSIQGNRSSSSSFNVSAPEFVPGQSAEVADDSASSVTRHRLSSSAEAYVPCWG